MLIAQEKSGCFSNFYEWLDTLYLIQSGEPWKTEEDTVWKLWWQSLTFQGGRNKAHEISFWSYQL